MNSKEQYALWQERYQLIEVTLMKFRKLGYSMDNAVYRALVKERTLLEGAKPKMVISKVVKK